MAIDSFLNNDIRDFFYQGKIPTKVGWKSVHAIVRRKLDILHYSHVLLDLRSPPGNRLEELKSNLKGFYSIRINNQWRIIFQWTSYGPTKVDIVDYH
jgi:proteic killer suppression protein